MGGKRINGLIRFHEDRSSLNHCLRSRQNQEGGAGSRVKGSGFTVSGGDL